MAQCDTASTPTGEPSPPSILKSALQKRKRRLDPSLRQFEEVGSSLRAHSVHFSENEKTDSQGNRHRYNTRRTKKHQDDFPTETTISHTFPTSVKGNAFDSALTEGQRTFMQIYGVVCDNDTGKILSWTTPSAEDVRQSRLEYEFTKRQRTAANCLQSCSNFSGLGVGYYGAEEWN